MKKRTALIAISAVLLVGAGSAAVLNYFATSSGNADVTQAVVFDNTAGTADLTTFDQTEIVAGDTTVDIYDVVNNQDNAISLSYSSDVTNVTSGNDLATDESGTFIDWEYGASTDLGVETTYATYHNAGSNLSDYDTSGLTAQETVTNSDNLQDVLDNQVSEGDTVIVEEGDYQSFTVSTDGVTIAAKNSPTSNSASTVGGSKTGILVEADDVTVKGFNITAEAGDKANARGIDVQGSSVEVTQNYVHNVVAAERPIGIFVFGDNGNDVNSTTVENNKIEAVKATTEFGLPSGRDESKTRGVVLTGQDSENSDDVTITQNTIQDIGNATSSMSNAVEVNGGYAQDFEVSYNAISDVDHGEDQEHFGTDPYTPTASGFYITGYNDGVDVGSNQMVSYNNFELSTHSNNLDVMWWSNPAISTLNADDNYWGEEGIQYAVQDTLYTTDGGNSSVSVSWNRLEELSPGQSTGLAIVNEFDQKMSGNSDYEITTRIS